MNNLAALPPDFDTLLANVPEGFSVSERVIEPVAILYRVSGKMSVALGGKRTVRGEVRLIEAPSISHAWIADGAILRPFSRKNFKPSSLEPESVLSSKFCAVGPSMMFPKTVGETSTPLPIEDGTGKIM